MAEIIELFLAFQGVLRLITKALVAAGVEPGLALYLPDYGVLVVGLWAVVMFGGPRAGFIGQGIFLGLWLASLFALAQAIWMLGWWVLWVSLGWVVLLLAIRVWWRRGRPRIEY